MKYRVAPSAIRDMEDIDDYVAARNPVASVKLLDVFERRWKLLATQPWSGRPRDDVIVGLRSVVIGTYVAFYYIDAEVIVIVRVLHGSRDITGDDFAS